MKTKNKRNQCKNCLKIFSGISDLKRHEQRKKMCQKREESLQSTQSAQFEQSLVKSTFFQEKLSFYCKWCGKSFPSHRSLTNHDVRAHSPPFSEPIPMEHICCETLIKVFKDVPLEDRWMSFYEGMAELIRLVYFNETIPENCTFTVVYPNVENGAISYNFKLRKFERVSSILVIKEKVQTVIGRLIESALKIAKSPDISDHQFWCLQNLFNFEFAHEFDKHGNPNEFFKLLQYLKSFCYSQKDVSFRVWHQKGFDGKEFSLNYGRPIYNKNEIKLI